MSAFTLLCDGEEHHLDLDRGAVGAAEFAAATGWTVEDRGLCRGDICIPAEVDAVRAGDRVDVAAAAGVLRRPWILEPAADVGVLGDAAADRATALMSLQAPDFALPDLNGERHRLSDYRGRKVLLAAYASW